MSEYAVFISYSHRDAEIVVPIVQILRAPGGGVFWDAESIPLGTRWRVVIATVSRGVRHVPPVLLRALPPSTEVRAEWGQPRSLGQPVLPLLLDHTPLAPELADYQGIAMPGFLGDHREEEVEDHDFSAMPGGESTTRMRGTVLRCSTPAGLLFASLDLWERLGGILSGEPKPASATYDADEFCRIIVAGKASR